MLSLSTTESAVLAIYVIRTFKFCSKENKNHGVVAKNTKVNKLIVFKFWVKSFFFRKINKKRIFSNLSATHNPKKMIDINGFEDLVTKLMIKRTLAKKYGVPDKDKLMRKGWVDNNKKKIRNKLFFDINNK